MSESPSSRALISRLERIRRIAYRRWVLYGVAAVASGGVYALLTVVFLDWWLELPAVPRLAISVLFLVGFALAATHWIFRPLRSGIGVEEIAGRIERYFGDFRDRLSSLVSFARSMERTSPRLVEQFLDNTERIIAQRKLESVLTARPLIVSTVFLFASVSILALVASTSPDWLWTGMSRYLDPFGAVDWPRDVQITPLTRRISTPLSESAHVRMRVTRGLEDTLRGVVQLVDADGRASTQAMSRNGDEFEAVIQPVLKDMRYWFEAGDADTRLESGQITVVHRPRVETSWITVHPPAYAADAPPTVHVLSAEPVDVIAGSLVEVTARSSKPLRTTGNEASGLLTSDGRRLPPTSVSPDRMQFTYAFEATEDVQFRIHVVDRDGFENQGADLHTLLLRQDAPPRVSLLQPASSIECTARCLVPLRAEIEDDFGVAAVALESSKPSDEAPASRDVPFGAVPSSARGRIGAEVAYDWDVATLQAQPGDILTFRLAARDNFPGEGQVGRSASLQLRVISDAEYERQVREQLHALERQVRQARADQAEVLETLEKLQREQKPGDLSPETGAAAAATSSRQARLARSVKELARRFSSLSGQMQANGLVEQNWPADVAQVGERLRQAGAEPMRETLEALEAAGEAQEAEARAQGLERASANSRTSVQRLQETLDELARWADTQGFASRLRDFIERQEALRQSTTDVGKNMVGIPADALEETQQAALEQVARVQEQLAEDVEKSLARLREQAEALPDEKAGAREGLEAVAREAASNDLARHMTEAAGAIRQNRTAAAGISQQAAEDAMRKLASGLRENRRRELEELRKDAERAEETVAQLLREQERLLAATREAVAVAAPQDAFAALSADQEQLRTNTRWTSEEIADLPRTADAARVVRLAVAPMGDAASALTESRAADAVPAQDQAVRLLEEALAALSKLADEVRQEITHAALAEIRIALQNLVEAQRRIGTGVAELNVQVAAAGRVGRLEAKTASDLARQQSDSRKQADEAAATLEQAPVFHWSLQRVSRWMADGADRLSRRAINEDLVDLTRRILTELEMLSAAVDSTEALVTEPEFAGENQGGGEGEGGQQAGQKPVPTLTELLVLKAMQVGINERTRLLNDALAEAQPTEAQLRQLRALGEDQADIRRLTEKLTEAARSEE